MNQQDIDILSLKKELQELQQLQGRATELISLYVPQDTPISQASSHLRDELGQCANIKSKSTRKNVTSAITSILSRLKLYKQVPDNGLVFFVGAVTVGNDQSKMMARVVEPPLPVPTYIYHCHSTFHLEPLEEMVRDKKCYGVVVMDLHEVTVALAHGGMMEVVKSKQSRVQRKQRQGGQSAQRFERLRLEAIHDFFKKASSIIGDAFLPVEKDLVGIIFGGPGDTKDRFLAKNYLDYRLQSKVLEPTHNTGYTTQQGIKEVAAQAHQQLSGLDTERHRQHIQRFLKELTKINASLATYGPQHVRNALRAGAVETLLVSEETDAEILQELSQLAQDSGATMEIISAGFQEGVQLQMAFGGIAALLRWNTS